MVCNVPNKHERLQHLCQIFLFAFFFLFEQHVLHVLNVFTPAHVKPTSFVTVQTHITIVTLSPLTYSNKVYVFTWVVILTF